MISLYIIVVALIAASVIDARKIWIAHKEKKEQELELDTIKERITH